MSHTYLQSVQNAMDGAIEIVEKKMEERKQIGEKKVTFNELNTIFYFWWFIDVLLINGTYSSNVNMLT